nr:hypothetical protein Iba_chr14eCG9480 [Ipomoea batatas]
MSTTTRAQYSQRQPATVTSSRAPRAVATIRRRGREAWTLPPPLSRQRDRHADRYPAPPIDAADRRQTLLSAAISIGRGSQNGGRTGAATAAHLFGAPGGREPQPSSGGSGDCELPGS